MIVTTNEATTHLRSELLGLSMNSAAFHLVRASPVTIYDRLYSFQPRIEVMIAMVGFDVVNI